MNASKNVLSRLTLGLTAVALSVAGLANAQAGEPHTANSTVTRTGPAGNTSTRQTSVTTNGQGGYTAHSTITSPAGNVSTHTQSGTYDPATKTYSSSGTTTYPNGKQSTFTSSTQATGNGYVRSSSWTGPNGRTVTSQGQATYDPATRTINQSRTTTSPFGGTSTESRTIQPGSGG